MKRDSRLSGVLHVLLHMAERDGPVTSEMLAKAMHTNPVVIRRDHWLGCGTRDMCSPRKAMAAGGRSRAIWPRSRVRDIYDALGRPSLLAMSNQAEAPDCLVKDRP